MMTEALDLQATLFVTVRTSHHDADWLKRFADGVARMPEVVEFYRLSGDIDYLIKLCLPDVRAYDEAYKKLIHRVQKFIVTVMEADIDKRRRRQQVSDKSLR